MHQGRATISTGGARLVLGIPAEETETFPFWPSSGGAPHTLSPCAEVAPGASSQANPRTTVLLFPGKQAADQGVCAYTLSRAFTICKRQYCVQVRDLTAYNSTEVSSVWNQAVLTATRRVCSVTAVVVREVIHSHRQAQGRGLIHLSARSCQWQTPPSFLALVKAVFQGQGIDLDPCSCLEAQERVQARKNFTLVEDGLSQQWQGRVFVNPPFGKEGGQSLSGAFFEKAAAEYISGNASEVLLLLKAAIGYAWFSPALAWPRAWLHARVAFVLHVAKPTNFVAGESMSSLESGDVGTCNPHGRIVVYMGPHNQRFSDVFQHVASIPGGNSWSLLK